MPWHSLAFLESNQIQTMKAIHGDSEKVAWEQVLRSSAGNGIHLGSPAASPRLIPRPMLWLILFVSASYVLYTLKLISMPDACTDEPPFFFSTSTHHYVHNEPQYNESILLPVSNISSIEASPGGYTISTENQQTELQHVVFGIAGSAKLWNERKEYLKLWFRPQEMRGSVWLENEVKISESEKAMLPVVRVSGDTSKFPYTNKQGHRSAIRLSRIVSETLRLGDSNVRWFVMGDDDTVFVTENLLRVLRKYDHKQLYYIGSSSESHLQNIYFSYRMAYGGGGFAISYPLAKALAKIQDKCIMRYPGLYGSDDRIQACMAELGVPLTTEAGFHQNDVYGNLFGLLAAHPIAPFVSLHHLDVVEPIFPNVTQVEAIRRMMEPMKLDSAALMQQSICYDRERKWTVSVSWGFAVQIFRGIFSPREIEMPSRTFLNWYRRADYTAYSFNTRPVSRNPCQKPFAFYFSEATVSASGNMTETTYERHRVPHPACRWKMPDPNDLDFVLVFKAPDPHLWDRSPRRNCCRVMGSRDGGRSITVDVGVCREGEISEA